MIIPDGLTAEQERVLRNMVRMGAIDGYDPAVYEKLADCHRTGMVHGLKPPLDEVAAKLALLTLAGVSYEVACQALGRHYMVRGILEQAEPGLLAKILFEMDKPCLAEGAKHGPG